MIAGDTIAKVLYLQTLGGRNLVYASKAAFQADGWNLSWVDSDGVALSSQPTWTLISTGSNGRHIVEYTCPTGVAIGLPTVPGAYADPGTFAVEGEAYDSDSIAGLFLTAQGVPGVQSAADGDLGDVVMGDSWHSGTLTVPLGKISRFGYSTLSGFTVSAGLKRTPADTSITSGVTAVIISNSGLTCSVSWNTFPVGMNLGATASDLGEVWYLDLQLKNTGATHVITPLRYQMRVVWQRDVS